MDNFDLSSVNAEPEVAVEPQQDTTVNEPVNAGSDGIAPTQTDSKPVQTPEQNAEFAKVRRETESKFRERQDNFAKQYGYDSFEELEQAQQQQQVEEQNQQFQEQYGIDPKVIDDRVKALLEEHPTVKAAREQENLMIRNNAAMELSKVAKSIGINEEIKTWEDVEKLPKWESIKQGVVNNNLDIVTAAKLAYFDEVITSTSTKAQQDTINKIAANGASSPGSLVNHGTEETFFTKEQVDKMSKKEVLKNYDQIIKSTPKW